MNYVNDLAIRTSHILDYDIMTQHTFDTKNDYEQLYVVLITNDI